MYTTPMEAFRDLVIGMNRGLTEAEFTFRDSQEYSRAKEFKRMTQSITERPLHVRRETNRVEVRIYG